MLVEKLTGVAPYSTFADLKNNASLGHFTHRLTWTYADYTPTDDALTVAIDAYLAKNAAGASKGLLKGWLIRDVVAHTKTAFSGITNQATAVFDLGITTDTDKFIDAQSVATSDIWDAYTAQGDGDTYGYVTGGDLLLKGTLTATVSSGSAKLDTLTAGEVQVYMEIVDMNELSSEGSWRNIVL
jgi:hypothetical protein